MDAHDVRTVTLDDVGALAGVSGKTVSRVVNRDPHVSARTREKVEEAIRLTGYRLNMAARALAASKSYLIGMFVPDYTSLYHAELYRGAASACAAMGYHLLLEQYDERAPDTALGRYEVSLRNARCDGIVLPPYLSNHPPLLDRLSADGVRHVRIAPTDTAPSVPAVSADEAAGLNELADYLWSLGHRRFGICSGPTSRPFAHRRNATFLAALERHGVARSEVVVADFCSEDSLLLSGRQAAKKLLDTPQTPEAIFAFNDELAHGIMTCAHDCGLRVPQDVSVVGFDDGPAAQFAWPSLTTIRQPIADMGARAVDMLTGVTDARHIVCPVKLVVRESSGKRQ